MTGAIWLNLLESSKRIGNGEARGGSHLFKILTSLLKPGDHCVANGSDVPETRMLRNNRITTG
jgi:hypothetical protein